MIQRYSLCPALCFTHELMFMNWVNVKLNKKDPLICISVQIAKGGGGRYA